MTVSIGGNDANFAGVLTRCLTPLLSCEGYLSRDDANDEESLIEAQRPRLAAAYRAIRARAPQARVVAVTYPNLFRPGTTCLDILNLPVSDIRWLISMTFLLDDVIDGAARDAGIEVLDERYAFYGHELCTGRDNSWVYSLPGGWPGGSRVLDTPPPGSTRPSAGRSVSRPISTSTSAPPTRHP